MDILDILLDILLKESSPSAPYGAVFISNFSLTKFNVVIPIKIILGQKLLSQIWHSELLFEHYSEITEPVNAFCV